jgi:hypothetical protein
MLACLWCLRPIPDARSRRAGDHCCSECCRREYRSADIKWIAHTVAAPTAPLPGRPR